MEEQCCSFLWWDTLGSCNKEDLWDQQSEYTLGVEPGMLGTCQKTKPSSNFSTPAKRQVKLNSDKISNSIHSHGETYLWLHLYTPVTQSSQIQEKSHPSNHCCPWRYCCPLYSQVPINPNERKLSLVFFSHLIYIMEGGIFYNNPMCKSNGAKTTLYTLYIHVHSSY